MFSHAYNLTQLPCTSHSRVTCFPALTGVKGDGHSKQRIFFVYVNKTLHKVFSLSLTYPLRKKYLFPKMSKTQRNIYTKPPTLASLLRTNFTSLPRAHEHVHLQNVRDFPQTMLDSEIDYPFLLRCLHRVLRARAPMMRA